MKTLKRNGPTVHVFDSTQDKGVIAEHDTEFEFSDMAAAELLLDDPQGWALVEAPSSLENEEEVNNGQ